MKKVTLCILDGVGMRDEEKGNAFKQAKTPTFDKLWETYPHTLLKASGEEVGLPKGQMGNSEVGHMNIGAGRIVYQPLQFITEKIKQKEFFQNEKILNLLEHVKKNGSKLHIAGLLSDGGIHSHIDHLLALIDLCKEQNMHNISFHIFTDGRDTLPNSSLTYIKQLEDKLKETKVGTITTICGRFYAMDRDNRYDRVEKAYQAMVYGKAEEYPTAEDVIKNNYAAGNTDEFIVPAILHKEGIIKENDGIIFFNYRPDRLREIGSALTNPEFNGFKTTHFKNIKLVTMMPISEEAIYEHAFNLENLENTLGEYLSDKEVSQLRIAETEKYAHVTYFFDGGVEKQLNNCKRILIPSPKVATYDLAPAMSAREITEALLKDMKDYQVIILNYANGDMLGHTGALEKTIESLEVMDECLNKLYQKAQEVGHTLIVTADHGNCEIMLDEKNNIITSHTTSLVPFIITDNNVSLKDGKLGDIAPTILSYLGMEVPKEMTGDILITEQR